MQIHIQQRLITRESCAKRWVDSKLEGREMFCLCASVRQPYVHKSHTNNVCRILSGSCVCGGSTLLRWLFHLCINRCEQTPTPGEDCLLFSGEGKKQGIPPPGRQLSAHCIVVGKLLYNAGDVVSVSFVKYGVTKNKDPIWREDTYTISVHDPWEESAFLFGAVGCRRIALLESVVLPSKNSEHTTEYLSPLKRSDHGGGKWNEKIRFTPSENWGSVLSKILSEGSPFTKSCLVSQVSVCVRVCVCARFLKTHRGRWWARWKVL